MKELKIEEYIKNNFMYSNGKLNRIDRKNSNGSYDKDGYLVIKIKGKQYKAHRIVWLLMHNSFPNGEIDHINRVRDDNRIENLRIATRKEQVNNTEKKVNKDTGVIGIYIDKSTKGLLAKYVFTYNNKKYRFRSLEQAIIKKNELCKD